jgi:DNA polymerase
MHLHIDIETRSAADLPKVGAYRYFEDDSTDVWCAAFAVDDEPVGLWHPGLDDRDIKHAIKHCELAFAHNANFERGGFAHILGPKHGFPIIPLEKWRCTMAMAYAMALPGTLDGAAAALGLDYRKDQAGHRLMLQLSRPRRMDGDTPVWWDVPEKLERLYAYCKQDVEVERALHKRLLPLRPLEQKIWFMDQRINDRGVYIDEKLALAAEQVVADATDKLNDEMYAVTGGDVSAVTNTGQLKTWLGQNGVECRSLAKDQLDSLLALDTPAKCKRALELRKEGAKSSTAKIDKMLTMRCADGRMRGNLQYHGANTGRWAARGAQLQNLPRPVLEDIPSVIDAVATGDAEIVDLLCGNPMQACADSIRGIISAPPGRKVIAADFSQIEARVLPWLAGDERKLNVFRNGEDIYCLAASGIFGKKVNKKDHPDERQVGKVSELALGFGGGAMAFAGMAANYGLNLEDMFEIVWPVASEATKEKVRESWKLRGARSGMSKKAWNAGEAVKIVWRADNKPIVDYWYALEGKPAGDYRPASGAWLAVLEPGRKVAVGNVVFLKNGSFLFCRLPSGRCIAYAYPRVEPVEKPWGTEESIVYEGVDSFTKKWGNKSAYGGLFAENITQAVARDIMAEAMLRVDAAGYDVTVTIHDEVVGEIRPDQSYERFLELMVQQPEWAAGLPIEADGFCEERYRK